MHIVGMRATLGWIPGRRIRTWKEQRRCAHRKEDGKKSPFSMRLVRTRASVDPWSVSAETVVSQLFAASLFPYLGFLYWITKPKGKSKMPGTSLFGFYFLLVFVFATIPAGIYAKVHYGRSLSNVDWLHGGAESLLAVTNLFIVFGFRQAIKQAEKEKQETRGDRE